MANSERRVRFVIPEEKQAEQNLGELINKLVYEGNGAGIKKADSSRSSDILGCILPLTLAKEDEQGDYKTHQKYLVLFNTADIFEISIGTRPGRNTYLNRFKPGSTAVVNDETLSTEEIVKQFEQHPPLENMFGIRRIDSHSDEVDRLLPQAIVLSEQLKDNPQVIATSDRAVASARIAGILQRSLADIEEQ